MADNRPHFVTRATLAELAQQRADSEFAQRKRQFRAMFNQWWSEGVLPALTDPQYFSLEGDCRVPAKVDAVKLFGWAAFMQAVNERLMATSAPFIAIDNNEEGLVQYVTFRCL